jgi:hypothetical protein
MVDKDFGDQLFNDPDTALAGYDLTEGDRMVITSIPRQEFEEHAQTFREGSVVGATIGIGIGAKGTFAAEEPDS